ncbi:MAG: hypothetical protein CMP61_10200 [Flavobacteriales bacterium]|nr:hypothetical protein [Flavobacteriales bacterium]
MLNVNTAEKLQIKCSILMHSLRKSVLSIPIKNSFFNTKNRGKKLPRFSLVCLNPAISLT